MTFVFKSDLKNARTLALYFSCYGLHDSSASRQCLFLDVMLWQVLLIQHKEWGTWNLKLIYLSKDGSRTPGEYCPQNQLSRGHRVTRRRKWHPWSLQKSALDPLRARCGCLASGCWGTPNMAVRVSPTLLTALGTLSLLPCCLVQP